VGALRPQTLRIGARINPCRNTHLVHHVTMPNLVIKLQTAWAYLQIKDIASIGRKLRIVLGSPYYCVIFRYNFGTTRGVEKSCVCRIYENIQRHLQFHLDTISPFYKQPDGNWCENKAHYMLAHAVAR